MSGARCFELLNGAWQLVSQHFGVERVDFQLPAGLVKIETAGIDPSLFLNTFGHLLESKPSGQALEVRILYHRGPDPLEGRAPPIGVPELRLRGGLSDRFVGHHRSGFVAWLDRREEVLVGCCDPQALRPTDLAKPMHSLWLMWHKDRNLPMIHAALVCEQGKGALLVGPPGAGKSTVALACLRAGMSFVADDYVTLVGAARGAGLYAGVWVEPGHAKSFGALFEGALKHHRDSKICHLLAPERLAREAPIEAVIVPRQASSPALNRISPEEAYLAAAPSSLEHLPSASERAMVELMRATPCYCLAMNGLDSVPEMVRQTLGLDFRGRATR